MQLGYGSLMLDPRLLDDLARRLNQALPSGAKHVQADLNRNLQAALQSALARLDLVTREEFDVQTRVLARSRTKLEQLEKQVAALEARLLKQQD